MTKPANLDALDPQAAELATLAWAIAHPARVKILSFLIRRRRCVCGEIVANLPLAQSTVSQHLKIMRDSGLLSSEDDGPRVYYSVIDSALRRLKSLVTALR
jgi:ArsR family transcriptional regulator